MDGHEGTGTASRRDERRLAIACAGLVALAAAVVAPFDRWFLPNAGFYLAEEAIVLLPLLVQRPRPAVLAGAMLAVAACMVAFPAWCDWRREIAGWVLFASCLPGGLAACLAAGFAGRRWRERTPSFAASATTAIVLGALLANAAFMEI